MHQFYAVARKDRKTQNLEQPALMYVSVYDHACMKYVHVCSMLYPQNGKIKTCCSIFHFFRSSGSLYRSRALIQALSTATRESRFEGPAVPGSNHTTPTGPSSSLKSKLELLGPDAGDGEELMSEGQRQLQQLLRKQLDTSTSFEG